MLARLARPFRLPRPAGPIVVALALLLGLGAAIAALGGLGPSGRDTASTAVSEPVPSGPPVEAATRQKSKAGVAGARSADVTTGAPAAPMPALGSLGGQALPATPATGGPGRVVKTAVLSIDVAKGGVDEAGKRVLEWVGQVGGFVQSSESARDQASLVIKVPSTRLEEVVARLRGLGKVRSETLSGDDVSQEYVDLESRLRHWRAQEAVFVELMGKAKTIAETVQIQQQLSAVQEQIEQLEGRRRYLDDQTSFSTVRLSLLETGAVAPQPDHPATTLARAWERATGAALLVVGGTLVALGVLVPLGLVLGVPALAVVAVRRRGRTAAPVAPAA